MDSVVEEEAVEVAKLIKEEIEELAVEAVAVELVALLVMVDKVEILEEDLDLVVDNQAVEEVKPGGGGGNGGNNENEAVGGVGGPGGQFGSNAGSGQNRATSGGGPGGNGAAIRRISGYAVTVNKASGSTVQGDESATGVN